MDKYPARRAAAKGTKIPDTLSVLNNLTKSTMVTIVGLLDLDQNKLFIADCSVSKGNLFSEIVCSQFALLDEQGSRLIESTLNPKYRIRSVGFGERTNFINTTFTRRIKGVDHYFGLNVFTCKNITPKWALKGNKQILTEIDLNEFIYLAGDAESTKEFRKKLVKNTTAETADYILLMTNSLIKKVGGEMMFQSAWEDGIGHFYY